MNRPDRPGSLAVRLTLWYAGIFAATLCVAFVVVYLITLSILRERTDEDLHEDLAEFVAVMEEGGLDRVRREMALEAAGEEAESVYFRLWSDAGEALAATDLSTWPLPAAPGLAPAGLAPGDEAVLTTLELPGLHDAVRVGFVAVAPGLLLEMGQSLEEEAELAATFLEALLVALAAIVLLGAPVGWFLARRALRSVETITQTAGAIADGSLERRVPEQSGNDELDRLARTFNFMVDRIETLITGMREMTDTLAHDLRSPLARIRASAETVLTNERADEELQSLASDTIAETERMLEMINVTLDITEAESGAARLERSEFDLAEVVATATDLFQSVAEDRGITLRVERPAHCPYRGDRHRLQRVVANLLDNALKYTEPNGTVSVALLDRGDGIRLAIADTGCGVSPGELSRIFERFYRCDRSRSQPGNGLGLSLALAFVRIHGGRIEVESEAGLGSTFSVWLPRAEDE
ncbi:MAG: ATP-binding protein [Halofilum sp. (in: g-proteobacteria)]|nr:ATP-binding protein [Halofilum sp. (in: g-proteobacteria)]